MKKRVLAIVSVLLVMCFALSACVAKTVGQETTVPDSEETVTNTETTVPDSEEKGMNIMFVVTGNLGGGTNNDDVYAAIKDYVGTNGNVDTFECNMDTSLYESTLMQAAESGQYDLIVTGFGTMVEPLGNTAAKFPNQKFFIFDTAMPFEDGKNANVMSVQVLQNEGGFLVGALAALMTQSTDCEFSNADKKVGYVGAIESTAILDFLMGYIEGVKYVDTSVEVLYSFVGDHKDSAKTKELATALYDNGADIIFAVSASDLAVADAALEKNAYAICVDADEATKIAATSPETANHIVTSVVKDYYQMVYPILVSIGDGTAQWGTHKYITYAEGGVIVADNEYFRSIVPTSVMTEYDKIVEDFKAGKITVSTAYGASTDDIKAVTDLAPAY